MTILLESLQNTRRWSALMLAVLGLGSLWIWLSAVSPAALNAKETESPKEGFRAPNFTLENQAGELVTLSDLRGQVVMINLWASWCLPCREEMPAIDQVYRRRAADGFVVLAVNSTVQDSEEAAVTFAESLGLTFPTLFDRDGTVSRSYQLLALPTSFFVDRRGIIREVVTGGNLSESLIESKIEALLAERGS